MLKLVSQQCFEELTLCLNSEGRERTPPCTEAHVSEIAANLWKAISENLGEDVKKSNLQSAIERYNSSIVRSHCWTVDTINLYSDLNESDREANSNKQKDGSTTPQYLKNNGIGEGGREIFRSKGLNEADRWDNAFVAEYHQVIEYLGGNPAYLESVSIAINKLFGGKVAEFYKYEELFLTEAIESMLTHQFDRLAVAEQQVIKYLAGEILPVSISTAIESLNISPSDVGNAIVSLDRRGLIHQTEIDERILFSLRSIVKKFILQLA